MIRRPRFAMPSQLTRVATDLEASLAELHHRDGRNVAVRALRQRLAFVQCLLARCNPRSSESCGVLARNHAPVAGCRCFG
jgi:hypothetical protein